MGRNAEPNRIKEVFTIGTPNFNFPTILPNMTADVPRDINALSIAVDTELAKKYTKPVAGIPISDLTDTVQNSINGSLKNTDKATQSEATSGINDSKFMTPLRVNNVTGKLDSLQTSNKTNLVSAINETFTQVVNGKNAIATAINDRGGSASGSDSFQELANKIDGLVPKSASGIVASSSSSDLNFKFYSSGNTTGSYFITVSGMSFLPKLIRVYRGTESAVGVECVEYKLLDGKSSGIITKYYIQSNEGASTFQSYRVNDGAAYVNNSGFKLPVNENAKTYAWYAYE